MKHLGVNPSEYKWEAHVMPREDGGGARFQVSCFDPRDGECMFVIPDYPHAAASPEERKYLLNVFLSGYYKGARAGADKKAEEIKKALNI